MNIENKYPSNNRLDEVYAERDKCVALLAGMASALGLKVGLGRHSEDDKSWEDDWRNIVFIDLPTGQISWHIKESELPWFDGLPVYNENWDGHTTDEKYRRVLSCARANILRGHNRAPKHINTDAHDMVMKSLRSMSTKEIVETAKNSGIYDINGKLTPEYGGENEIKKR